MKQFITHYTAAYRGLPREAWMLSIILLINRSGSIVLFFMSLYLTQELGYSIAQAGYVLSSYGLGMMSGAFLGGALTDRIGARKVQFFALLTGGLCFLILGYLTDINSILVMMFFAALTSESLRPANAAAIIHVCSPEQRARGFGLSRLAINLGVSIGPAVGGFLATIDYMFLFWLDGFTCIGASIFVWLFLPDIRHDDTQSQPEDLPETETVPTPPWRDPIVLLVMFLAFLCSGVFRQLYNTWPIYVRVIEQLTEDQIGLLMAFNAVLVIAIEMPLLHYLERKSQLVVLSIGALFIGGGFGIMPLASGIPHLVFTVFIWTIGEILFFPLLGVFIASRAHSSNRGQYMGFYTFTLALAMVVMTPAGSWVYDVFGPAILWYTAGLIGIFSMTGFLGINAYMKNGEL
ncbi:MAG: MDR family MFS transporter [Calditrichia bacterium]